MNKQGLAPIWVRITVDGGRAEFSTQKQIYPRFWDAENNLALKEFSEAKATNDFLTLVKADILRHYNMLISTKEIVTAVDVKNSYKGIKEIKKTFLQLFRQYNQQLSERQEIDDLSEGRYKRFEILYGKCEAFVKYKFGRSDILLEDLKLNFVVEFEHYLRTVQKIGHNTSMKYAKDLKQVMKYGVMLEYIPSNPFELFQCSYKKVKREFLDQEELDLLYKKEFAVRRLEEVRDYYLFSCYTGYAYSDAAALSPDDIAIGIGPCVKGPIEASAVRFRSPSFGMERMKASEPQISPPLGGMAWHGVGNGVNGLLAIIARIIVVMPERSRKK